jgi:hypothetical protein
MEAIQIFNKLNELNKIANSDVFKLKDKTKLLSNLNIIQKLLDNSSEIIPEYNLNLNDLPDLNIIQASSSEMEASVSNVQNLNTEVERS